MREHLIKVEASTPGREDALMKICVQDPVVATTYLLDETDLWPFSVDPDDYSVTADVLFVLPSGHLLEDLPASRLSDSTEPAVQVVDPDTNRSWLIPFDALIRFEVSTPPSDPEGVVWFAMPSAHDLLAAVPVFRKALVQHSS